MRTLLVTCLGAAMLAATATAQWPHQIPQDDEDELHFAWAITSDASGVIYVASWLTDDIWRIPPGGETELFYDASEDPRNLIIQPSRMDCDADGNLYVAMGQVSGIVKVAPDATTSYAIPPDGPVGASAFSSVVIGEDETLYATSHATVYKRTPDGTVTVIMDASGDGQGNELVGATGLSLGKDGNVFVCGKYDVFRIATDGTISQIMALPPGLPWSNPGPKISATGTDAAGNVYVASRKRVHRITPSGDVSLLLAGSDPSRPVNFSDIEVDPKGNVYVSDNHSNRLFHISPSGTVQVAIDSRGDRQGNRLLDPGQLTIAADGHVYVISTRNDKVFDLPPPQYFLVVGDSDDRGTFLHCRSGHRFTTQVGQTLFSRRLSIDESPSVALGALPFSRPTAPGSPPTDPFPIDELFAQVLVFHPQAYPQQPERFSAPMRMQLWSNGALTGIETGQAKGLHVDLRVVRDSGGAGRVELPFVPYR